MKEQDVKYLAGLIDADGYFGFEFHSSNKVYLIFKLCAAHSIDKHRYVASLPELTTFGSVCTKKRKNPNWSPIDYWSITKRRDLEMFIPRIVKHLVIKGKHAQRLFDKWREYRGVTLTDLEVEQLKAYSKASRLDAGPLKPKKHPSWAWVAGYLDGDGSYIFSHPPSHKNPRMLIQATAHKNDRVSLDLLNKAFGGRVETRGKNSPHILDWRHNLGKREKSFAIKFLQKVVKHSKLKKHKIETMLAYIHSNYTDLHRLSEVSSTE